MEGERELSVAEGDVDCAAEVNDLALGDCDCPGDGIEGVESRSDLERDVVDICGSVCTVYCCDWYPPLGVTTSSCPGM